MVNKNELEAIMKMEASKRYEYSLKKIADNELLFGLKNKKDEWAISDLEDNVLFSIWSAREFVEPCLLGDWKNFDPVSISIDELETSIVPYLIENNYLLEVQPIPNKTGFIVDVDEFFSDLSEELEKYD